MRSRILEQCGQRGRTRAFRDIMRIGEEMPHCGLNLGLLNRNNTGDAGADGLQRAGVGYAAGHAVGDG